ncbi:hypothetical protein [Peribacillus sp. SCS-37]
MEMAGNCRICGKEIFCRDGFLDGAVLKHQLYCQLCAEIEDKKTLPIKGE